MRATVRLYHSVPVPVPVSCVSLSLYVSLSVPADAQMAHLVKQGLASAVITEDSDMLPYGLLRERARTRDRDSEAWGRTRQ